MSRNVSAGASAAPALHAASEVFAASSRVKPLEWVFWLLAVVALVAFPRHYLLINEIAILGLFALSLDIILGYAGIVSLGHAAFFGLGAYVAALFAKHVHPDPLLGLVVAMFASGFLGLVASTLILRGSDLTRIMVTLGVSLILYEVANRMAWLTLGLALGLGLRAEAPGKEAFNVRALG